MFPDILVVGAGIFGATAARELRGRGHAVTLVDAGPVPHPLAASTDISKVVRMEYGRDEQYMEMVERSLPGFRRWNEELGEQLYHQTGVTMFTRSEMAPGGFEYESYHTLLRRGHTPERLDAASIARRFPAWNPKTYVDGFFHEDGGYVESGRLVSALVNRAEDEGVQRVEGRVASTNTESGRVRGVTLASGRQLPAGCVLVAAGAWSPLLVPGLSTVTRSTGHPVFHLDVGDPALFTPPQFCTFMGDVAETGWYGFPYNPREGVVKIANHGIGERVHPESGERVVRDDDIARLRTFLRDAFPSIADAKIVYTRRCLYLDTLDEHFWIDRHPDIDGLCVATGGSGHGFKFAPVLGPLIADAVEAVDNPWLHRFSWRTLSPNAGGEEASRHHGQ